MNSVDCLPFGSPAPSIFWKPMMDDRSGEDDDAQYYMKPEMEDAW